ncbi:WGR domain-containing protein [Nocardia sp. NPDC006044]|uniref:WGR domain-containing protein n=1 Tax=Nocardia sp. NPDC006044 TaxID=3364306 RepID=UPI00368EAFE2
MSEVRYFEKNDDGAVRFWRIRRDGIRCHMSWGQVDGRTQGSSMTLDDLAHAERHVARKIGEKQRQGYVEVTPPVLVEADEMADAPLLDVMRVHEDKRYAGAWDAYWAGYAAVDGRAGVFAKFFDFRGGPGPFYEYLVLSADERRGLQFVVKQPGHDLRTMSALLDFVCPRTELAFDGRSHHKLPAPIGRFDHVLLRAPSLCGNRYGGRMAGATPIFDCEIGDQDTETLVEARLQGRDAMPSTSWDREPYPVIDLKFDLRSANGFADLGGRTSLQEKKFKVYRRSMLERGIGLLSAATPDSTFEIRNFRREILTLTPADVGPQTPAEIGRFLLGDAAGERH